MVGEACDWRISCKEVDGDGGDRPVLVKVSHIRVRFVWAILAAAAVVASVQCIDVVAAEPNVRAVKQLPYHCGPASARTILRAYGINELWTKQDMIAASLCARMPEFKHRRPAASDAIETYYPDFEATYQPELAELLIDHGLCVISTRGSIDKTTGQPMPVVVEILRDHLKRGHMSVIHVQGHYMVAVGLDEEENQLHFVDPGRPESQFCADWRLFSSGESFHTRKDGSSRPGWSGRALIFWRGKTINGKDQCPVCGQKWVGTKHYYCPQCRCWIERRESRGVQRVLDEVRGCVRGEGLINVSREKLRRCVARVMREGEVTEEDVRQALIHYPMASKKPRWFETLYRHADSEPFDLTTLSLEDLVEIVSSRDTWQSLLEGKLAERRRAGAEGGGASEIAEEDSR